MKRIYSVVSNKYPNFVAILSYTVDNMLASVTFNETASNELKRRFGTELPVTLEELFARFSRVCTIKDISNFDLSFEKFWDTYGEKIKPMVCKKLWNKLEDEDKILALGFIKRMRLHYDKHRIKMPHPERYLRDRRWEDNYE